MASFNNLEDMFAYIQKSINETLKDEVKDLVTEVMDKQIDEKVYNTYTPNSSYHELYSYDRRGELGDPKNIVGELIKDGELAVKNVASPSPSVLGTPIDSGNELELTSWIIKGQVPNIFNDKDYTWMHERDFIDGTKEELKNSGELRKTIIQGLKKRGIKVI